ncbi:Bos1 protein [Starmerella bacillaris]|uniref:Protein transport protein BOS1 n=1 Tax=Starmerella bacillaris TaxID=1247836 RepID=A0AAV5REI9_STABA|nr:Bos1 protein [Starmerella bacillaris]
MSSLLNNAVKQSNIVQSALNEFKAAPEDAPAQVIGQATTAIASFQRAIDSYATAANNEIIPEKKQQAQTRVLAFREELVAARDEMRALKSRREEILATQTRNELFRRPVHQNQNSDNSSISENPFEQSIQRDKGIDRAAGLARENDVLGRASQQLDDFIASGRLALSDLTEQNDTLRRTGRSMRKVANGLGISNETIRRIQRRAREDKFIFYGGVITVFGSFYLIYRYLK